MTARLMLLAILAACYGIARWGSQPKRERRPVLDLTHNRLDRDIGHYLRALPGEPGYPEDVFPGGAEAPRENPMAGRVRAMAKDFADRGHNVNAPRKGAA